MSRSSALLAPLPATVMLLASLCLMSSHISEVSACNNAICGPMVSKCMLIKCCTCDMSDLKNCTCCRDCQICLKSLYTECCSCVGLCPPPDPEDDLGKTSSVEDLPDPIPDLFNVLTEQEDFHQRWTTFTFAVDLDKLLYKPQMKPSQKTKIIPEKEAPAIKKEDNVTEGDTAPSDDEDDDDTFALGIQNCTVAFFSDCMSMGKCKASCRSMGAAKYRWFHEHGCCQCVGSSCYDYGLSNPQCLRCPEMSAFKERYMFDNEDNSPASENDVEVDGFSEAAAGVDAL